MKTDQLIQSLYRQVTEVILARQHPVSGLLPASTSVSVHGDYQDAWVRDNVYSIQCAWALCLACRRHGHAQPADRLEQATIKLMRGLLRSMMRQAHKVERFKHTQQRLDALHAKYDTATGDEVVADDAWGHLQLDATSLYLLSLAQMTSSGLRIIATFDEVDFIQNLVYYTATAYRTPDFGIWERGNKINDGKTEINASSLGMAKSALLAMDGLNLFGPKGPQEAVIHVIGDAISHARTALAALLPRESLSKEVDAALLSVIGYPAFAVGDPVRVERTKREIQDKLAGRYGCKRFLLDGHQTVLEDTSRIHYEHSELVNFEHIESEWPLFFCYMYINALYEKDTENVENMRQKLAELTVEKEGFQLLPELYYVPRENIQAEKAAPHSQSRTPNDNLPLIWAQSLYLIGRMLDDGLLELEDLDPVRLRQRRTRLSDAQMALVVLAENDEVKQRLAEHGIIAETPADIAPLRIVSAPQLVDVFAEVGKNEALKLSGRPRRSLQSLSTAQTYRINDEGFLCLSWLQSHETDYRLRDPQLLAYKLDREVDYTLKHWFYPEVAVFTFMVTEEMCAMRNSELLLDRLRVFQLRTETTRVGYASARLAMRASRDNRLQVPYWEVPDFEVRRLQAPANIPENILKQLQRIAREPMPQLIREALNEHLAQNQEEQLALYRFALMQENWWLARLCFSRLGRHHRDVPEALTGLIARHITLVLGGERDQALVIDTDNHDESSFADIQRRLEDPVETVLVQEMLIIFGALLRTDSTLFEGVRTIEIHNFWRALLVEEEGVMEMGVRELTDRLGARSPGSLYESVKVLLGSQSAVYKQDLAMDFGLEESGQLHSEQEQRYTALDTDWFEWRHARGLVPRFNKSFLQGLWGVLGACPAIEFTDIKVDETRLDSERVRSSMTAGEESFAQLLDELIGYVHPPYYRTACAEVLLAVSHFCRENPEARFSQPLLLLNLFEKAAYRWADSLTSIAPDRVVDEFLGLSPKGVQRWLAQVIEDLLATESAVAKGAGI